MGDEITTEDPQRAVEEWFTAFGRHVRAGNYTAARQLVAADVVSFGTEAEFVEGIDHLVDHQWTRIWPNIADFTFETVRAKGTTDEAWGAATWTSTGFDDAGTRFHRPGRATITFDRRDGRWLAVHTHFSLVSGTPDETFGPTGRTE